MRKSAFLLLVAALCLPFILGGCDDDIKYYQWNMVQLEAEDGGKYVCGNGTAYKFFVNPSLTSKNWLIYYEGGGACWDYDSCSGKTGIRGAANPNGVPDDYMAGFSIPAIMSPFIFRAHPWERIDTQNWNIIFVPYCTGDIFIGNNEMDYKDPNSDEVLNWRHNGFQNTLGILDWMKTGPFSDRFDEIPKLMVTGCSAGGAGSLLNYHFIRQELGSRVDESVLLNDSGPIYYTKNEDGEEIGFSGPLHEKIKTAWNVSSVIEFLGDQLPETFLTDNFGTLSTALSDLYPKDKIAHTQFTRDGNYSGYSYERFYTPRPNSDQIHNMWAVDQGHLMAMYDLLYDSNLNTGYFIPYYRPFNESHCSCILSFDDTDITGTDLDVGDYAKLLLDSDKDMADMRMYETPSDAELKKSYPFWNLLDLLMGAL